MIKIGSIPVTASTLLPSTHNSLVAELFSILEAGGTLDAEGQYPVHDVLQANPKRLWKCKEHTSG
jgi:hypothetical protein